MNPHTVTDSNLNKQFLEYIQNNDIENVARMLGYNDHNIYYEFDINAKFSSDTTALLYTVSKNNKEIFNMLINHPNIDVNYTNNIGWTPLLFAAFEGFDDILLKLLRHPDINCDVKIKDIIAILDFIEMYTYKRKDRDNKFLIDYDLQKDIIENNEKNILIFDKYNLVHPKIKEEHPALFTANEWGLIV